MSRFLLFYVAALGVLALDYLSKLWVRASLPLGQSVPLIPGFLHLTHVRNAGAVFGLFPGGLRVFVTVSLLIMVVLMLLRRRLEPRTPLVEVALGLQLGGTWGNFLDRVGSGLVTDFLDFRVWPVFNVADSGLVVGALLLAWWVVRGGHRL
ncbi:MAG: signal peptidase II [bacterium]|nr:signal peptidase II [bacterium]